MRRRLNRWTIGIGLFVALVVALAVIAGTVGQPTTGSIEFELRKYVIQFLLIVALGAVIGLAVESLKQRREAADRERKYAVDTLTSLLDRLDRAYRAVKWSRRRFRVAGITDLSKDDYVEAMSKLSDNKQEIEEIWRDIEVLEVWLPELKPVRPFVTSMENYLHPLEEEWETLGSTAGEFDAGSLEALAGFSAKARTPESTFQQLRKPYYDARKMLVDLVSAKRTGGRH